MKLELAVLFIWISVLITGISIIESRGDMVREEPCTSSCPVDENMEPIHG